MALLKKFYLFFLFFALIYGFSGVSEEVFTDIYRRHLWGTVSVSGGGSDLEQTSVIREKIPQILRQFNCRVLVDAPCGDFYWMKHIDLPIDKYIGVDVVQELIEINQREFSSEAATFMHLDLTKEILPQADMILCRDCLVHLSFRDIAQVIKNFKKSGATYVLMTTFIKQQENYDIPLGSWRALNFVLPPFNFQPPLAVIVENCTQANGIWKDSKSLGLWKISELPDF